MDPEIRQILENQKVMMRTLGVLAAVNEEVLENLVTQYDVTNKLLNPPSESKDLSKERGQLVGNDVLEEVSE